jgi:hypothetical protein
MIRFLRVTGPLDVWKVPIAAAIYMILPWPPDLNQSYLPSVIGSILHLFSLSLLPHMLLGFYHLIRAPDWRQNLPILVFPVLMAIVLGTLHLGLVRYRETFYPLCLVWAAIGWRLGTPASLKFATYGGLIAMAVPVMLGRLGVL